MASVGLRIQIDSEGNVTGIERVEEGLDQVERNARKATAELAKVHQAANKLATGAMVMGGAVMAASYGMVQAASDLEEAQNKVGVIFGESGDAILAWSEDSAKAMGMSRRMALEAAGGFGVLFDSMEPAKAAEMSQEMVGLAADIASINNLNPEEALTALRAGLVGETEPLRRVGILLNAAAVEAKAMEMGLADANGEVSEAAKVKARYALIMEQSTKQQGDFARTAEGAANQERILKAQLEDTAAVAGGALKDSYTSLLAALSPVLEATAEFAATPAGQTAIKVAAGLGALAFAAGGTYKGIKMVTETVDDVRKVATYLRGTASAASAAGTGVGNLSGLLAAGPYALVALAIAGLVVELYYLKQAYDEAAEAAKQANEAFAQLETAEQQAVEQGYADADIQAQKNKEREGARVTVSDVFWGAVTGGGRTSRDIAQERVAAGQSAAVFDTMQRRRGQQQIVRQAVQQPMAAPVQTRLAEAAYGGVRNIVVKIGETELRQLSREESYDAIETVVAP